MTQPYRDAAEMIAKAANRDAWEIYNPEMREHVVGSWLPIARAIVDQPWHDPAREVLYWSQRILDARLNLLELAKAAAELNNAISDLASFLPEYDYEQGVDSVTRRMEDDGDNVTQVQDAIKCAVGLEDEHVLTPTQDTVVLALQSERWNAMVPEEHHVDPALQPLVTLAVTPL